MPLRKAALLAALLLQPCIVSADFVYTPVDGAICMDGTTTGYYYSVGSDASSRKVAVGLMSGRICGLSEHKGDDCRELVPGPLGSSASYPSTASFMDLPSMFPYENLVMGSSQLENAHFHDFHKIWIPQCSGDMHIGRLTKPNPMSYGFTHAGAGNLELILKAVHSDFQAKAIAVDEVLLTGVGTGGYGALMHCNSTSLVWPHAQTSCAAFDGFFFPGTMTAAASDVWQMPADFKNFAQGTPEQKDSTRLFGLLLLWQADVGARCAKAVGPGAGACLSTFTERLHTVPRIFIAQNRYDPMQLAMQGLVTDNSSAALDYIRYYGDAMRTSTVSMTSAAMGRGEDGVFLTSCHSHGLGNAAAAGTGTYQMISINAVTAPKAVGDWYHRKPGSHIHEHTCTDLQCDPSCASMGTLPVGPQPAKPIYSAVADYVHRGAKPMDAEKESPAWKGPLAVGITFSVLGIVATIVLCIFSTKCIATTYCCGVGLLVAGLLVWGLVPMVVYSLSHDGVQIKVTDSESLHEFSTQRRDDAPEKYVKFWAWNITNLPQVVDGSEKPMLSEVGPFVYRVYNEKGNVTTNDDGTRVEYTQVDLHVFDAEASIADETVYVYAPSIAYATLVGRFANSLGLAGEGELQLAFPAFLFESILSTLDVNVFAPLWGNSTSIDAMVAQQLGVPQLPFVVGFRTYTTMVMGSNAFGLSVATSTSILTLIRYGPAGQGAGVLLKAITGLKAAARCIGTPGVDTPCAHLQGLLAILHQIDPAFADPTAIPMLSSYFTQLTQDRALGAQSMSVMSAMATTVSADGVPWTHRTFSRLPVRDLWFNHDHPMFSALAGVPFPGVFTDFKTVEEGVQVLGNTERRTQGTGSKDWRDSNICYGHDSRPTVPFWATTYHINTSSDSYVPPSMSYAAEAEPEAPEFASLWVSQALRTCAFQRVKENEVKGVETNLYLLHISTVAVDPIFYNKHDGFISLVPAYQGAQIYLSAPHFAYAFNSSYREKVSGMLPDEDPENKRMTKHISGLSFEPLTGMLVEGYRRIQMNILIGEKGGIDHSYSFPGSAKYKMNGDDNGIMLPTFHLSEEGILTDAQADKIKAARGLFKTRFTASAVCWIVGPLFIVLALVFLIKQRREAKNPRLKYVDQEMEDTPEQEEEEPRSPDNLLRTYTQASDAKAASGQSTPASSSNVNVRVFSPTASPPNSFADEMTNPTSPPGCVE
ncbi:Pectin acetylesterase 7 [Diplonema papillatum]|nr:Pectin acetylesterase 7 [Diplonema papillatum]